jgi:hypothetical protein
LQGLTQEFGTVHTRSLNDLIDGRRHRPRHPGANKNPVSPSRAFAPSLPTLTHILRLTELNTWCKLFLVEPLRKVLNTLHARGAIARPDHDWLLV